MALNKANLKGDLQALFANPPVVLSGGAIDAAATRTACADAWAAAYASYAAGGRSCQSVGPTLTGRQAALSTALAVAFGASTNPATTAASFDAALVTFWTAVGFAGATTGLSAVSPGTLTASLPAMWANNVATSASYSAAAQAHADVFDIFTKTVIVTHAPPSVCAAPLT